MTPWQRVGDERRRDDGWPGPGPRAISYLRRPQGVAGDGDADERPLFQSELEPTVMHHYIDEVHHVGLGHE